MLTPIELADVPRVDGSPRDQRVALWKLGAELASTSEWAEFGVSSGSSTDFLLSILPAAGQLHCFDSQLGLPEAWDRGTDGLRPAGSFAAKYRSDDKRVISHIGWFRDTVKKWSPSSLGLVHFDCDIYSSTIDALRGCDPYLHAGAVLIFDEAYGYPTYLDHEWKAIMEWGRPVDWRACGRYQALGVLI